MARYRKNWRFLRSESSRIVMFVINFNFAVYIWTTQHTAAQAVLTHVHVIKTFMQTLYKLRDSLSGLHCCRSEVNVVSRVSYGTDNVIVDRGTGDRVYFDSAARVIRAGETAESRPCHERQFES